MMRRDFFAGKIDHLMGRWRPMNDTESDEFVRRLWMRVSSWSGDEETAFGRAIDHVVATHKGGRPTVKMIVDVAHGFITADYETKQGAPTPVKPPAYVRTMRALRTAFTNQFVDEVKKARRGDPDFVFFTTT